MMLESCNFIQDEKKGWWASLGTMQGPAASERIPGMSEVTCLLEPLDSSKISDSTKKYKKKMLKKLIIRRATVESISKYFKAICIKSKIKTVALIGIQQVNIFKKLQVTIHTHTIRFAIRQSALFWVDIAEQNLYLLPAVLMNGAVWNKQYRLWTTFY